MWPTQSQIGTTKMIRFCRIVSFKQNTFILRKYATKEANQRNIKYTDTINLPKTKFPQRLCGSKLVEVEKSLNKVSYYFNLLVLFLKIVASLRHASLDSIDGNASIFH